MSSPDSDATPPARQPAARPASDDDREVVDAGEVSGLHMDGATPNAPVVNAGVVRDVDHDLVIKNRIRITHSWTAVALAFVLVVVLVGSTAVHYFTILALARSGQTEVASQVSPIFDKWFPVITGFTGSAITYFLTRDRA